MRQYVATSHAAFGYDARRQAKCDEMKWIMKSFFAQQLLVTLVLIGSTMSGPRAMADENLIDDFRSSSVSQWRYFADTVMGGVSSGQASYSSQDGGYAKLSGLVSTANNGGFIQIRKKLASAPPKGTTGIRLVARGNSQRYFVHLRTRGTVLPWQYYQAGFDVKDGWREFRLPLSAFQRSGRPLAKNPSAPSLRSVAIVAFGRDHSADVQIKEIGFY